MAKDVNAINLLPHKGDDLLTQFLNWALTIGRLLIILTETVALATFVYRFSLDMKIVDLHDAIKNDRLYINGFSQTEATARNLQDRIAAAKQYDAQSSQIPAIFKDITALGQGKVTFQSILISTDAVKIEASTNSVSGVAAFVEELKKYPQISGVSVDKVENRTSNASIQIAITALIKNNTPKKPAFGAVVPDN